MGLDLVELVLAVEEAFGVELSSEWGNMRTVGDLHIAVCSRLQSQRGTASHDCPSLPTFFVARNAIQTLTKAGRSSIRPSTELQSLFKLEDRRNVWQVFQEMMGFRLPRLIRPQTTLALFTFGGVAPLLLAFFGFLIIYGADFIPIAFIAGLCIVPMLHILTRQFAVGFPKECQTVSDVVRQVHRPRTFDRELLKGNLDPAVWRRLSTIVSDQLDIPIESITRDSRFIEDLKCG